MVSFYKSLKSVACPFSSKFTYKIEGGNNLRRREKKKVAEICVDSRFQVRGRVEALEPLPLLTGIEIESVARGDDGLDGFRGLRVVTVAVDDAAATVGRSSSSSSCGWWRRFCFIPMGAFFFQFIMMILTDDIHPVERWTQNKYLSTHGLKSPLKRDVWHCNAHLFY